LNSFEKTTVLQVYIVMSSRIVHFKTVDLHSPHLEFEPKIDFVELVTYNLVNRPIRYRWCCAALAAENPDR
jgi:hypothetical protein